MPRTFAYLNTRLLPRLAFLPLTMLFLWVGTGVAADDKAADKLLADARKALDEKNYPTASTRFKEFLAKYGAHKDIAAARYGLALALLELPDSDLNSVLEQLHPLANNKDAAEYPSVLYHLGVTQRGIGVKDKIKAGNVSPQDAAAFNATAKQRFEQATKHFAAAALAYTDRAKKQNVPEPKPDQEAAFRARLAQAEMLLQLNEAKEAESVVASLLKDTQLAKGRAQRLALYYDGWARFLLKDYQGAGRALSTIVAFGDAEFGTHARFLLARIHHLEEERAEATAQYESVLNDFEAHKKNAQTVLKRPDLLKNNPREKARLEGLVKGAAPDHVARANFYLGVLSAEGGRFADAITRFANFQKSSPRSPLVPESLLRQGICQVQLKQFNEAMKVLAPLTAGDAQLLDQALFWLGKAQANAGDPNNPAAQQAALKQAVGTLRQAADKAKEREASDPDAKARRGAILLELADTLQQAQQYKDAAAAYEQILTDKAVPSREAEVLQRLGDALNLAGDYAGSDKVSVRFLQEFPKSPLLPAVQFRHAENAAFLYLAAEKDPQLPNKEKELERLGAEAAKRYQALISQFPEFEYANLARFGLGVALYRKGEREKAKDMLATISTTERIGELALASYLQADCLIRLAPVKVEDALTAGKLQELMQSAVELLEAFANAQPKGGAQAHLTVAALLKIGYCHQRLASLQAQPAERAKFLTAARVAYKRIYAEFAKDAAVPYGVFEEAKCFVQLGNAARALANLQRFTTEPLNKSPVAPMALLNLATLLRSQNKPADAATILTQCVEQFGPALRKDPTRAGWLPLLQLHLGICLREAGKLPEARGVFETIIKEQPNAPEAVEAALRRGQCLKEEVLPKVEQARQKLATPNLKPDEVAAVLAGLGDGLKVLAEASKYLEAQAEELKKKQPAAETRARMLYEAAWAQRYVAEAELAVARVKPDAPKEVPLQPAEKKARDLYQAMIAEFAELPLAVDARLELGEMLAERGDPAGAIKLFSEAIDQEPAPDVNDKLRVRLGAALAAKGDAKAATGQFEVVARNPKSPLHGAANAQLKALKENKPLPALGLLGQARPDRASLEDATGSVSLAAVSLPVNAQRTRPAPSLRVTLPDPYEFRYAIRPASQTEDIAPLPGAWPPGS